jgi:hypothetical protein
MIRVKNDARKYRGLQSCMNNYWRCVEAAQWGRREIRFVYEERT